MFILIFIVAFGPKKGTLPTYSSIWDVNSVLDAQVIFKSIRKLGSTHKISLLRGLRTRVAYTAITSRLTSYFLFSFWLFFFFYGESLLLIILNYTTVIDSITSSIFMTLKQHIIFYLTTTPVRLTSYINFYIYFLTSCAVMFLLNFNYLYNHNYFKYSTLTNVSVISVVLLISIFNLIL